MAKTTAQTEPTGESLQDFAFPTLGVTVQAENLEKATQKALELAK